MIFKVLSAKPQVYLDSRVYVTKGVTGYSPAHRNSKKHIEENNRKVIF
jgi:hypothetical protein